MDGLTVTYQAGRETQQQLTKVKLLEPDIYKTLWQISMLNAST